MYSFACVHFLKACLDHKGALKPGSCKCLVGYGIMMDHLIIFSRSLGDEDDFKESMNVVQILMNLR